MCSAEFDETGPCRPRFVQPFERLHARLLVGADHVRAHCRKLRCVVVDAADLLDVSLVPLRGPLLALTPQDKRENRAARAADAQRTVQRAQRMRSCSGRAGRAADRGFVNSLSSHAIRRSAGTYTPACEETRTRWHGSRSPPRPMGWRSTCRSSTRDGLPRDAHPPDPAERLQRGRFQGTSGARAVSPALAGEQDRSPETPHPAHSDPGTRARTSRPG